MSPNTGSPGLSTSKRSCIRNPGHSALICRGRACAYLYTVVLRLHFFLRLAFFWLTVFTLFRLLFLGWNGSLWTHQPLLSAAESLVAGIRLDLSTLAYLVFPAFFLWCVYQFRPSKYIAWLHQGYQIVLIFLFAVLHISTMKMYHEWNSLLSVAVADYLRHPGEVISFISAFELAGLVLLFLVYLLALVWLYRKIVVGLEPEKLSWKYRSLIGLVIPVALGVGARGGFQLAPINESSASFSEHPFFNHVAINPFWYFVHSVLDKDASHNPYILMDEALARQRYETLYPPRDTAFTEILDTTRPNLVFILLESWTADIIESLGGEKGITPAFDSLRREGLLFTHVFGAGARTEHGLVSVLSGYPPPPKVSIITIPSKSVKLPSISTVLFGEGYSSSFYYGGEIGFVNMKSFLLQNHFKMIVDKSAFSPDELNSKWGAHDEFVFRRQLEGVQSAQQPFLSVILTLSTHEPFEVPLETPFHGSDEAEKFKKAAFYTDHCLGDYFREARKEPWYDQTLFILVADHGHRLPRYRDLNSPSSKHITLLLYGNVLKKDYRGKTIDVVGNQHDLPATLLAQLHLDASPFTSSRNLLGSSAKEFAYYVNDNVMGWITPSAVLSYDLVNKVFLPVDGSPATTGELDSIRKDAAAFLQYHYQEYLDF